MSYNPDLFFPGLAGRQNPESYEMLYKQYGCLLYGVIKAIVKNNEAAAIILEHTFIKVYGSINKKNVQISFLTFAIQQARAAGRDYRDEELRSGSVTLNQIPYISASKPIPVTDVFTHHNEYYIFDLILQGYQANEVAAMLALPPEIVRKTLRSSIKLKITSK